MRAKITYFKYFYYLVYCGSLKKIYNYILNKVEKKQKRIFLKSLPVNIVIEPCNICNLRCPGCTAGMKYPDSRSTQMLTFKQFKCIFDQVKDYVFNVSLFKCGEPFLNKDIFLMIDYAYLNRCGTTIHSNFNIFNESMAEEAIRSRLTHIYLSIDGATQKTYEEYRKGGDLSAVFRNIEILVKKKRQMGSIFPLLTWKYLTFPHNVHEIELAKQKSRELGVDAFEVFNANLDNLSTFAIIKYYDLTSGSIKIFVPDFCNSLWDSLTVCSDGSVLPCCRAFREKDIFGNICDEPLIEVWNNDNFLNARSIVKTKKVNENIRYPCSECEIIRKFQS